MPAEGSTSLRSERKATGVGQSGQAATAERFDKHCLLTRRRRRGLDPADEWQGSPHERVVGTGQRRAVQWNRRFRARTFARQPKPLVESRHQATVLRARSKA